VQRSDIVDYATYNDTRDQTRPAALAAKAVRRIHLHEHLTFLFENRSTLCYQIQEIMRVERLVRAADIDHEIATCGRAPVAIGTDFHVLECEVDLTAAQIAALSEDVAQ